MPLFQASAQGNLPWTQRSAGVPTFGQNVGYPMIPSAPPAVSQGYSVGDFLNFGSDYEQQNPWKTLFGNLAESFSGYGQQPTSPGFNSDINNLAYMSAAQPSGWEVGLGVASKLAKQQLQKEKNKAWLSEIKELLNTGEYTVVPSQNEDGSMGFKIQAKDSVEYEKNKLQLEEAKYKAERAKQEASGNEFQKTLLEKQIKAVRDEIKDLESTSGSMLIPNAQERIKQRYLELDQLQQKLSAMQGVSPYQSPAQPDINKILGIGAPAANRATEQPSDLGTSDKAEGTTAINRATGQRIITKGGRWVLSQ